LSKHGILMKTKYVTKAFDGSHFLSVYGSGDLLKCRFFRRESLNGTIQQKYETRGSIQISGSSVINSGGTGGKHDYWHGALFVVVKNMIQKDPIYAAKYLSQYNLDPLCPGNFEENPEMPVQAMEDIFDKVTMEDDHMIIPKSNFIHNRQSYVIASRFARYIVVLFNTLPKCREEALLRVEESKFIPHNFNVHVSIKDWIAGETMSVGLAIYEDIFFRLTGKTFMEQLRFYIDSSVLIEKSLFVNQAGVIDCGDHYKVFNRDSLAYQICFHSNQAAEVSKFYLDIDDIDSKVKGANATQIFATFRTVHNQIKTRREELETLQSRTMKHYEDWQDYQAQIDLCDKILSNPATDPYLFALLQDLYLECDIAF
jgi:hypothetical protein